MATSTTEPNVYSTKFARRSCNENFYDVQAEDNNDPDVQEAIMASYTGTKGDDQQGGGGQLAYNPFLVQNIIGNAHFGGQIELLQNQFSSSSENMEQVLRETHTMLRFVLFVPNVNEQGEKASAHHLAVMEEIQHQSCVAISHGFPLFYPSILHKVSE